MDRVANAPSNRPWQGWRARRSPLAPPLLVALVLAAGLPGPAFGVELGDLLRSGAGLQAAREAQRAMQGQRTSDAGERQRADDETCIPVKSWVASLPGPTGARRPEEAIVLLEDEPFAKAFGKTYDKLTIADFRRLQEVQFACQRAGTLTPAEQQTVQLLLNPSMQPQLSRQLAATRAQRGELQALRSELASLPPGLPGLERGVAAYNGFVARLQRGAAGGTDLASLRDEVLAQRAPAVTAATPELSAEVQKAKSEPEVGALLSRYLLDVERQQAGRTVTRLAGERVAALRQAAESQRVAAAATSERAAAAESQRVASSERNAAPERATPDHAAPSPAGRPPATKPSTSGGGTVLTDPNELKKYEAGSIVRTVYHADMTGLKEDTLFARKYLIAQAGHLGGNCDSFKATEVRAYETALQRQVATAVQQNTGELLRQTLNLYVQAQRNMASVVDAGAAQQRIEDAPEFAVSDIERLAKTYGGCDSPVIVRYTRNLRAVLDKTR